MYDTVKVMYVRQSVASRNSWGPWRCVKGGSHFHLKRNSANEGLKSCIFHDGTKGFPRVCVWGGGGGVLVCFAFLHLIITRGIHLDLLSNEWAHVEKKCLTYGLVEFDMCLSKKRHYISTVIILYKQNVLCARMLVDGPVEEIRAGALALRPPLAPERDATDVNKHHITSYTKTITKNFGIRSSDVCRCQGKKSDMAIYVMLILYCSEFISQTCSVNLLHSHLMGIIQGKSNISVLLFYSS